MQCFGKRRETNAHANHLVVARPIDHRRHQIQIGHLDIFVHQLRDLRVGQFRIAIQLLKRGVDNLEHTPPLALVQQLVTGELVHVNVVALLNHLANLRKLWRNHLGHFDAKLHVVVVLFKARHVLHVAHVIGEIIIDIHRGEAVETLNHHAFAIHIGEPQRANDGIHAALAPPCLHRFEQFARHFLVVDKIEPAETHHPLLPLFVGPTIDNGCHTAHYLLAFEGQKIASLATFERRIAVAAQRVHLILKQKRNGAVVAPIEVVIELDELSQVGPTFNSLDFNH